MVVVPRNLDKKANIILLFDTFKANISLKTHDTPMKVAKAIAAVKFIINHGVCPYCSKPLEKHEWNWSKIESYELSFCNNCRRRTRIKRIMA